jgi:FR47-like protein
MALRIITDHAEIADRIDAAVVADPVRNTILGTIGQVLEASAWLAEWDGGLAARSASTYPVVLAGSPDGVASALADAICALPGLRAVSGSASAVRAVLASLPEDAVAAERADRLFRLDRLIEPTVSGRAVTVTEDDRDLLAEWYPAFVAEADPGFGGGDHAPMIDWMLAQPPCWLWLDPSGVPVSMAARRPVIAGSARVGPVYTPPQRRGQGYASGVTAAATRSILDEGAVPVLFTDLANPTSNKIYRVLGYEPVEDRLVVTLRQR